MANFKLIKIKVTGKVQGVFFRKNTAQKANELNLTGTVKNESDGSVSIVAQGEEKNLNTLVEWCHHGPPNAQIERVETSPGETKLMNEFRIVH